MWELLHARATGIAAHSVVEAGVRRSCFVPSDSKVFSKVIDGELSCDPGMTPADIWTAIGVAKALTTKA